MQRPAVNTDGASPRPYALLAIGAAILTIALKAGAYALTGSVGLLSDAAESVINLVAAIVAFWALTVAALPPDEEHAYGHSKAEYFATGAEGALILLTAVGIGWAAWERLWNPRPLEHAWTGLGITALATAINGVVGGILMRAGRRLRSVTLEADARHLFTDVWTSAGVFVGVALVALTGWLVLDPIIALFVAVNILWTAWRLVHDTALGLLDTALPPPEREAVAKVLAQHEARGSRFHALRTRVAGRRRFVSVHVLVPGAWSVQAGHDVCEAVEHDIRAAVPDATVDTHLEPAEDQAAYEDQDLDRP